MKKTGVLILLIFLFNILKAQTVAKKYDVIVYGGTAAGVIAAYTASEMGKLVLLVEPGKRLGGLTTGGLGYTDIGNKYAIKGLSLDFYRKVGEHYGNFEQWIFEPHVAEKILLDYLRKGKVPVWFSHRIVSAVKVNGKINSIVLENSDRPSISTNKKITAKEFIDCSYEGDLMAKAGVTYAVGREDNKQYNESYNGSELRDKHQFPDGIDPYKIPGKPESGLVWGVSANKLLSDGTGNKMVQTYNIRVCLTKNPANRLAITKPVGYDPNHYELLLRLMAKKPIKSIRDFMTVSEMPNDKTDINNNGPFSTDMIGMSWKYPEASYKDRQAIFKAHENYTKSLFYFVGHDKRVPLSVRTDMLQYGYPKDEYQKSNNFTTQMYVREARRMVGEYVMTQGNCQGKKTVDDGIGMAAYTMDSHNAERLVVNGMVKNEGDVQIGGFGPYPVSYRSLVPKAAECTNLLVPVCLSASHIAYGSIRMEPVFMMLAQSAATAACLAIDHKVAVQNIDVRQLQSNLKTNPLADGSTPEILVDNEDTIAVKLSGNWVKKEHFEGSYGPSLYLNEANKPDDSASLAPVVKKAGYYKVYTYVVVKLPLLYTVWIDNGKQRIPKLINTKAMEVKGQTEGEWVPLGKYYFETGSKGSLTFTTKSAGSPVLVDAVLFIPARR